MVTRNAETRQGDGGLSSAARPQNEPAMAPVTSGPPPAPIPAPAPPSAQELRSRAGNQVFKSGPLFISSKGIGWTSWKKRWFILTRTSLVFFRSDPSAIPQRGSEVNLTLGGIDLNNSGSVVVREDKRLLTVLFPDGRDGRAFTLKAESSEDLLNWKAALENALAQAPSAGLVMGQNGIFRNDQSDAVDEAEQWKNRQLVKSLVVGRPILLALEDIDGAPSFLEKALTFIEQYGVKTEGILRQAADVDDVNRRVREYEEGKTEFTAGEDAHVIADCVKHVLRGLPSSPVPASCCNALLEACRADHRGVRVQAMRDAITETFPEPNSKLLQRILKMMQIVASHKSDNRMSSSAVAACMAPLLLRPLLAGDCDLENDFNMGGDGSVQLLQAAAAANHAQAIVITLMEDYDKIFGDDSLHGSLSPEQYSGSEGSGDELTDDEEILIDDDDEEDDDFDSQNYSGADTENDHEDASSGTYSESVDGGRDDAKPSEGSYSDSGSAEVGEDLQAEQWSSPDKKVESNDSLKSQQVTNPVKHACESQESVRGVPAAESPAPIETDHCLPIDTKVDRKPSGGKRRNLWGRTAARKILSMESIDYTNDDEEIETQRLKETKTELKNKIAKEVKENAVLHASLENRKKALQERRLALEKDVAGLQEQLQKEKDVRAAIEARLNAPLERLAISPTVDNKTKAELEEISQAEEDVSNLKNKVADLHLLLDEQRQYNTRSGSCSQTQQSTNNQGQKDEVDAEAPNVAPLKEKTTKSEDVLSSTGRGDVKTQETSSLPKKQPNEGSKSVGASGESSTEPAANVTNASSNSKKSCSKAEGNVSTSSALSKLTTRLNFLKERRTQIVNELQNIETTRGAADNPVATPPPRTGSR